MIKLNELIMANDSWNDFSVLEIRRRNDIKLMQVQDILLDKVISNLSVKYFLGCIVLIDD